MKKQLAVFLVSMGLVNAAQASIYSCVSKKKADREYFVITTSGDTGILHKWEHGFFKLQEGEVKLTRAEDGGPLNLIYTPVQEPIDWSQEKRCYAWGKASLSFKVKVSALGDEGSSVQRLPNISTDPRVMCSVPRVALAPAQDLTCRSLQ